MNSIATLRTCLLLLFILIVHKISKFLGFNQFISSQRYTSLTNNLSRTSFSIYGKPLQHEIQIKDILGREVRIERHKGINFDVLANKVILITGAAGSIGSELVSQIFEYRPSKVILLDNNESGLHDMLLKLRSTIKEDIDYITILADITDEKHLSRIFKQHKPQVILHAAAYKHVPILEQYPLESIRVNVGGTRNMANQAVKNNVERFTLISTDKAVNPSCVMGASKRICELIVQSLSQQKGSQTKFTAVRFGNVLGSRGSVVPIFEKQINEGKAVTVTHKEMTRYFMTIPEAVSLVIHASCMTQGGDIFMLNMGEPVPIVHLAEQLIRLRGLRPYQDVAIEFTGIRAGEKLHEELQYGAETSSATIHPSIVNLKTPQSQYPASVFLSFVQGIINWTPPEEDPDLYLAVLREASQIVPQFS